MKAILPFTLFIAGAALMQASIVETISLDLSPLHAGSVLSGTFTLSDSPGAGTLVHVTNVDMFSEFTRLQLNT